VGSLFPLGTWVRNPSLRSWPVLVFVMLVAIPPVALVVFYNNPSLSTFHEAAWILAAYFALAWLLLISVVVRPAGISMLLLFVVVGISLVTQIPLAIALESALHSGNSNPFTSVFTIGVPEELAKAIPVIVIALAVRRRLAPADYLFLGSVSGLVFGASEAQHYLANGAGLGHGTVPDLVAALDFVWRFPTDPIQHACWAGITGYFIGLAFTGQFKWYKVCWIGLAIASVLHGLNDWSVLNGHWGWAAVVVGSGILFLTYAKAETPASAAAKVGKSREAGELDEIAEIVRSAESLPASRPAPPRAAAPQAPLRAAAPMYDIEAELAALKRQFPGNAQ
jgi:RsiW-degrading membrane proteinase PrsW (M82 family)